MALLSRLAIYVVQKLDCVLRLAHGRVGKNIEQKACNWVVEQSSSPGTIAGYPRSNSTIGVCRSRELAHVSKLDPLVLKINVVGI